MWTITDKQMMKISQSMRTLFEKRVYFQLNREGYTQKFPDGMIEENIHQQTEHLIKYGITDEAAALKFIKLSFLYPVMREKNFPDTLPELFEDTENESEKIRNLTIYLNENDYVSEF